MKRVTFTVALLLCVPLAAFGQARPVPPAPPAPPAPVVAPTPPTPPAAPRPPVPMVAPRVALAAPVFDHIEVDHLAIEEAVHAAHRAMEDFDVHAFTEQAMREIDVEHIKEQARAQADMAKEQAELFKYQAKEQAAMAKEQAELWKVKDFNFDFDFNFQGPAMVMRTGGDGNYNSGLSAEQSKQYDRAIVRFDQVIAAKGDRVDAAMYHKAYCLYKLGKTDEATATLAELRRAFPQSRYLDDSRVLEADARKTAGKPLTGENDSDEIKLLAISSLQNTNPEGAVSLLEGVLKGTNSLQLKKRAIVVLSYNEQPAAHTLLMNYAKGRGNPDLQIEAIRYLVARKGKTTTAELEEIYNSTTDVDVRRAVLSALMSSGDRAAVLKIATAANNPIESRRSAISNLSQSSMASPAELMSLYQKEENKDLKLQIVRGLGNLGAVDQLGQIIKSEKDASVRQQAIRSLGNLKSESTGKTLTDLYASETEKDVKKTIISSLGNQNNVEALIAIAGKETNLELKADIVRRLVDLSPKNKAAADFLVNLLK
jgi:HEAT repeat protein